MGRKIFLLGLQFVVASALFASGQSETQPSPLPPNTYRVVWVFNAEKAQELVNKDPKVVQTELPWRVLPLFHLLLSQNFENLPLTPDPKHPELWKAEKLFALHAPNPLLPPVLFYLVPAQDAGPRAREVIALIQRKWAQKSPFPLILSAPAFDQPGLDPRYDKATRTLTLSFP
jgi:hypothetical protein